MPEKRLEELLEGLTIKIVGSPPYGLITGITNDSRQVGNNEIFVALPGEHTHGLNFLPQAVQRGARAALIPIADKNKIPTLAKAENFLLILSNDIYSDFGKLASRFYEYPTEKLTLIGVTGTNGKTTVTYLLESIFRLAGKETGIIGTIEYRWGNKHIEASRTTPQANQLQQLLAEMVKKGVAIAIMEVSSHSLIQRRVEGCFWDGAIFTNLSGEHLDYHHNLEDYFQAKLTLFKDLLASTKKERIAVANRADLYGRRIIDLLNKDEEINLLSYDFRRGGDLYINRIELSPSGSSVEMVFPGYSLPLNLHLLGRHNVANALAAAAFAYAYGIPGEIIKKGLETVETIPGRLEKVDIGQPFTVLVDYAHTDDALQKVLETTRELKHNRILTLFGCGGERDRTKRPRMGIVAANLSDFVWITDDNPRGEDPDRIALDIEVGIHRIGKNNYKVILNRAEAIRDILQTASAGDIVLLAGKGHEEYQIIGNDYIPFSDQKIVRELLGKLYPAPLL